MKICHHLTPGCIAALLFFPKFSVTASSEEHTIHLENGKIADYGATPWYTDAVKLGVSQMEFIFDTGTNLFWATTDECVTVACAAHGQVSTSQSAFRFIPDPDYPKSVDFGSWGSMEVDLATVPLLANTSEGPIDYNIKFEASLNYSGPKFQYLNWGGGIGLPSESSSIQPGITDFFLQIYNDRPLTKPVVSFEMNTGVNSGTITFGNTGPHANPQKQAVLEPKKSSGPGLEYLWGTNLRTAKLGSSVLPDLTNSMFYLDTGSSRFKGGREFIEPILNRLLAIKDHSGTPIFETYSDDPTSRFTGIKYANGKNPGDFPELLPDFIFEVGQSCGNDASKTAQFTMAARNYSYKVEQGDRAGEYVVAFHVLDGVDGLLVGSTFMDGFSTTFAYDIGAAGLEATGYSQGNMTLYAHESSPGTVKDWSCVPR
ncbi:MAG: hypothetical protein GDA39_10480 [Hyphomonadaceae bacterium]|nr:hypothetical protein [Hyphomonadaceae bacterium]